MEATTTVSDNEHRSHIKAARYVYSVLYTIPQLNQSIPVTLDMVDYQGISEFHAPLKLESKTEQSALVGIRYDRFCKCHPVRLGVDF